MADTIATHSKNSEGNYVIKVSCKSDSLYEGTMLAKSLARYEAEQIVKVNKSEGFTWQKYEVTNTLTRYKVTKFIIVLHKVFRGYRIESEGVITLTP